MIFTRSSKVQTRASKRKSRLRKSTPIWKQPDLSDDEETVKESSPKVSGMKKSSTTQSNVRSAGKNEKVYTSAGSSKNVSQHLSKKPSKPIGADKSESNKNEIESQAIHDSNQKFKSYFRTKKYNDSLVDRSRGNPLLRRVIKEVDRNSYFLRSEQRNITESSSRRQIFEIYQSIMDNDLYLHDLESDNVLSSMGITERRVIQKHKQEYVDIKKELKRHHKCQTKRLRPRGEKIDYNVLNGSKPIKTERFDCGYESSNVKHNGSVLAHPCKCEANSGPDDIEDNTCKKVTTKKSDNMKDNENPIGRRRRMCTNRIINWKYCYDSTEDKSIKRKAVSSISQKEAIVPMKRQKKDKAVENEKSKEKDSNVVKKENGKYSSHCNSKEASKKSHSKVETKESNADRMKKVPNTKKCLPVAKDMSGREIPLEKDVYVLPKETKPTSKEAISLKMAPESNESTPPSNQFVPIKPEPIYPRDKLKCHIMKVITDEAKIEISENPLMAELKEVNNEQFYRLVVVLQRTDFIVRNAVMKNIRGPNDTISPLYNCTVCHKDDLEIQSESKTQSSSPLPCKSDRKITSSTKMLATQKISQRRPKIPNLGSSMQSIKNKGNCRIHLENDYEKLPQTSKVTNKTTTCDVLPARVPPIIFPNHKKSPFTRENYHSFNNDNFEQKCERVVVKATCFHRRPRYEILDSDSDDSNKLPLDPDLKDRIIADIAQTGKSIPDLRTLRKALKRMGRRKTNPEIHPITRRLNQNVLQKINAESETTVKRPTTDHLNEENSELSGTTQLQLHSPDTVSQATNQQVMISSRTIQKLQVDNRGRYIKLSKSPQKYEETPATALTASERLKLQKLDNARKASSPVVHEPSSSSVASSSPVRILGAKKDAESGEESDFELDEVEQPSLKIAASDISSNVNTSNNFSMNNSYHLSCPRVKVINKESVVNLSEKSVLKDKTLFRKILPRPNSTSPGRSEDTSQVLDISDEQSSLTDGEDISILSSSKEQEREMLLLKSILRQETDKSSFENASVIKGEVKTIEVGRSTAANVGKLRVPPASSYVKSVPVTAQRSKVPSSMRPITIRMTRVKIPSSSAVRVVTHHN